MNTQIGNARVWGIGLGRTGTRSLCDALRLLGYENVVHVPPFMKSLDGVDAAVEGFCISHFRYLDLRFPGSKFILTTRELEAWLASCKRALEDFPKERMGSDDEFYNAMIRNRSARYGVLEYEREALVERYFQHHYEVVSHFKGRSDQLLVIDMTKGEPWAQLCPFLNLDLPNADFPHVSGMDGLHK
ncbi:MAG: sulfotransferase [Opitutaceae bacterium]